MIGITAKFKVITYTKYYCKMKESVSEYFKSWRGLPDSSCKCEGINISEVRVYTIKFSESEKPGYNIINLHKVRSNTNRALGTFYYM